MTLTSEIGHSSYMIGKAEARLRYQRKLSGELPADSDPDTFRLSALSISNLEGRLIHLYKNHFRLMLTPK